MRFAVFSVLLFFLIPQSVWAEARPCLNPFSTVDWSFFVDKLEIDGDVCVCATDTGVKVGFKGQVAEPIAYIEVTKKAYDFPCIGMEMSDTLKDSGSNYDKHGVKRNMHYVKYPVFGVLNVVLDFLCVEKNTQLDIAPPSELDPRQNDDELSVLFQPDKLLYANPVAQAICFADCVSSSLGTPLNSLYWCAGCWGTMGTSVGNSPGKDPVVESALLAAKEIDFLHQDLQLWKYSDADGLDYIANAAGVSLVDTVCEPKIFPRIIKSQYYLNLSYPTVADAIPIGDFGFKWSFFRQYPGGEDFVWTVWRLRNCCLGYQFP